MECIEARALKSSFLPEITMKSADDLWVAGINTVPADDFSVDDLLDFSDKDFIEGSVGEIEEDDDDEEEVGTHEDNNSDSGVFPVAGDFGPIPAGDLAVPVDGLENLEWLSQFVDDSASELSLLCPAGSVKGSRSESEVRKILFRYFPTPVPVKTRSKRQRKNGGVWSQGPPSLSYTAAPSSSFGSSSSPALVFSSPVQLVESSFTVTSQPPAKKQRRKKNPAPETGSGSQTQRRCSHCQVQKTPQWRTGPLGAKTLCNACGVRFKSGRLLPEYRPACSPTFSGDVHSNSHRKVLEMRRKKEVSGLSESGSTSTVPIY